jgi:tyrosyl-tRNA synthetase
MGTEYTALLSELERRLTDIDRDLSHLSADEQFLLLKSRAAECVKESLLRERLRNSKRTGTPLKVKYGIDPTAAEIHLGHVVSVVVARRLLQMGHRVILLLGDFTAFVGDPTGRVQTRPVLTEDQIRQNVASYTEQVSKFIDVGRVEVVYNFAFYKDMSILDLFRIYRLNRVSPLLQREDFRNRSEGLTIAEALYPTLMAIDSTKLEPDLELGGKDQLLNFQVCADFMESLGQPAESALTTELLQGVSGDGSKMSKSLGNYISLTATADEAYGKVLSMPDRLMEHYFKLLTDITDGEWASLAAAMQSQSLNPLLVKKLLARIIVTLLHSPAVAAEAERRFEDVFAKGRLPNDMPEVAIDDARAEAVKTWTDLLLHCGFAKSKTEAQRLTRSGGVRMILGDATVTVDDPGGDLPAEPSWVVNVGKRRFARVRRAGPVQSANNGA